jgi:hypothetical protein
MSGNAPDPRYFNMRSYLYFKAAEWVKSGGWLPNVPGIVREATAATYWFENGKFRVEEKKQIKSRIGVSPDYWDAFMETFALPEAPRPSIASSPRWESADARLASSCTTTTLSPTRDLSWPRSTSSSHSSRTSSRAFTTSRATRSNGC